MTLVIEPHSKGCISYFCPGIEKPSGLGHPLDQLPGVRGGVEAPGEAADQPVTVHGSQLRQVFQKQGLRKVLLDMGADPLQGF